jgi:hypothetical protein
MKMKKISILIVLAAVITLVVFQDRYVASKSFQSIDSVVSVALSPAHAGAGGTMLNLDITNPNDREVIAKVLNLIIGSTVVGDAKGQFVSFGGSPTVLILKFKTGESLTIEDAVGSVSRKVDNGVEVRSESVQGQVTAFDNDKAMRVIAPDLKLWIEGGWSKETGFQFCCIIRFNIRGWDYNSLPR